MKLTIITRKKNQQKHRKVRKTHQQYQILQEYLKDKIKNKNKIDSWQKQQILKISQQTSLTKNQVYKWLWDQKHSKQGQNFRSLEQFLNQQIKRYINISIKDINVKVPPKIKRASLILIQQGTLSNWAIEALQSNCWQLIHQKKILKKTIVTTGKQD